MKRTARIFWIAAALLGLGSASCTVETTEPGDIDADYGGLTASDEAVDFGEADSFDLLSQVFPDQALATPDETAIAPDVLAEDQRIPGGSALLTALWGNLKRTPRDASDSAADGVLGTNWSGSISVDRGALVVKRRILFDRGDLLLPRTDRKVISFRSMTYGHIDGLLIQVVAPPEAVLTFDTVAYKGRATLAELLADPKFERVSDTAQLAVVAVRVGENECAHGLLAGKWHELRDNLGVFRGRWVSSTGEVHGKLRGIYGQRRNGEQVFFGKYIGGEGRFRGLLSGKYDAGKFAGIWVDKDRQQKGRLHGRYIDAAPGERDAGFFAGYWVESCKPPTGTQPDPTEPPSTDPNADSAQP